MRKIAKLRRQGPRTATRACDLQTDDVGRQRGGGTGAPAVGVRGVGGVVIVAGVGAVAKCAVGEVAFDAGAICAVGIVEVPAP